MAPEVVCSGNRKISKSVDIWAIGVIMFELLSGGLHPLGLSVHESKSQFQQKLKNAKDIIDLGSYPFLSAIAKTFLERLL